MVSSPSLPSPILCLGKLHPTGLSYFRPYSECSPLPLPVSKQAPSGKTGALNFNGNAMCMYTGTLSAWPHSPCGSRKSFVLYLGFVSVCPTPLVRASCQVLLISILGYCNHQFPVRPSASAPPTGPHLCSHGHPLSSWPLPCLVNSPPPRSLFSDSPRWAPLRLTPHSMSPLMN